MKLSKNSVHLRLWKWFYHRYSNYVDWPTNLCPFFWQLVLMYVLFIPNFVYCFVYYAVTWIGGKPLDNDAESVGFRLGTSTLFNFIAMLVWSIGVWIVGLFVDYPSKSALNDWAKIGEVTVVTTAIALIVLGLGYLFYKSERSYAKSKLSQNIVVEFIKAKYNKYCPQIEWIDNETSSK